MKMDSHNHSHNKIVKLNVSRFNTPNQEVSSSDTRHSIQNQPMEKSKHFVSENLPRKEKNNNRRFIVCNNFCAYF